MAGGGREHLTVSMARVVLQKLASEWADYYKPPVIKPLRLVDAQDSCWESWKPHLKA